MDSRASGQDLLVGTELGHHRIVEKIGAGGMGVVYRARDEHLKRDVAVKVMPAGLLADTTARQRFRKEALALSELNHPNIAVIHDFDTCNDVDYLVEELIPGMSLGEMIEAGALSEHDCIGLGMQLCAGLTAAHERGIIHRDIKPGNLRVTPDGHLKILDFGLAKSVSTPILRAGESPTFSETQAVVGTYPYMSPEQLTNKKLDARTDIWSAGTVLYEMATGRRAFAGSGATLTDAILHASLASVSKLNHEVSPGLEAIIQKCLEKDPALRYQSAREIAVDLKRLSEPSSSLHAVPPKRRPIWIWLSAAAVVLVVLGAVLFWRTQKAKALTAKDTIVLADFTNTTSDPVFTDTLRQGLLVKLNESPFLNILPEDKVRTTLKQMGRKGDESPNDDVAREVCERTQSKALISGSIAGLGSQYVLGLKAINCLTGSVLAQQQTQVAKKEDVLDSLGKQAVLLRNKLGESLASIQKFDVPLQQATTSSLEALQAYSLGVKQQYQLNYPEAITFFRRAIELDPNFAMAYAHIATSYNYTGREDLAKVSDQKAFSLRDSVTERERFHIEAAYYSRKGELQKAAETNQLWMSLYPQDAGSYINLSVVYGLLGQYDKALSVAGKAFERNASTLTCSNLVCDYIVTGRLDDASRLAEGKNEGCAGTRESTDNEYIIAFLRNDRVGMQRSLAASAGTAAEPLVIADEAGVEAYHGRLRNAREGWRRAVEILRRRGEQDFVGTFLAYAALTGAAFGTFPEAQQYASESVSQSRAKEPTAMAALAYAQLGDARRAEKLADELAKRYPEDTLVRELWLPTIRASIEISQNNPANAIEILRSAAPYELSQSWSPLAPVYVRGQAYLRLGRGTDAAAEFQKILDNRGFVAQIRIEPLALAHVGLARAYVLQGNTAKAKAEYEYFLNLWKDADPDVPIYQQAKVEYAKLQ